MTETNWPNLREDDFIIRDFRFASGETLPELRQHYITLGTPRTDAAGRIVNASLLIHNTTGTARPGSSRRSPASCSAPASRSMRRRTS